MLLKNSFAPLLAAAAFLSVGFSAHAANVTWTGATNGTWDTTTANWANGSPVASLYVNTTDAVLFDDTGANKTVSLVSGLTPASVTVNNSLGNNYTFQTNGFGGSGSLTKQGTGTLTLSVANTYSGGTTVSAGTLALGNLGSAGSGAITLNDASTGSNNTTLNFSAGNVNYANAITVANQGSGTTTLAFTTASNTATWTTGAITLNKATTFTASSATNYLVWSSASLSGSGPLTIGSTNGQRLITLFTTTASYTGDVTVGNGTNATVLEPRAAFSQNNFTVNALSTLQGFGNMTINGLNGVGTVTTFNTGGTVTLGNAGGSGVFSGAITNGAGLALKKSGAGVQVLSGAANNTYANGTLVSGGTLVTNKTGALGTGSVNVNTTGATLQIGDGSGGSVNTVTLGTAATLAVADGAFLKLGAINLASIDATAGTNGVITLTGAGVSAYNFNASGKLNLNGVLDGLFTTGTHTYNLIVGADSVTNELKLANITGFNASGITLDSFTNGVLTFTAVPEPSTYGLIGAGALAAVAFVRRRRKIAGRGA